MFNLKNDIRSISYVKSHAAEIIRQVEDNKNPFVITQNGEAKAVIIDVESYQKLIDAVNLMKVISIGDQEIVAGKVVSHDEVKNQINKLLG
ncbi:MAG: type II toxin-antitoxin system Phd/YefM family antitoxin [Spirochaetales bacterium]|nr:type II toxin-antitoxin system Phd/YefM family antitoxin [Spirochaetales bacterium]